MTHDLSCKELVDLVTEYMDEALSVETQAKFEQHLNECGYCNAYVEQMLTTVKLTGNLSEPEPPKPAPTELLNIFRQWRQENKPD